MTSSALAQDAEVNALKTRLENAVGASDSLRILLELSKSLVDKDTEDGKHFANLALQLAKALNRKNEIVEALREVSNYQRLSSEFEASVLTSKEALELLKDTVSGEYHSTIFLQIGKSFQLLGRHDSAIFYLEKSIAMSRSIGDSLQVSMATSYLGESYNRTGKLQRALDLGSRALNSIKSLGSKKDEVIALNFLGATNVSLGQFPVAMELFLEALSISDSLGNVRLQMEQLNDIGVIYAVQGDNQKCLEYFNKALDAAFEIKSHRDYTGIMSNIAYIYSVINEPERSLEYYKEVLAYNATFGDKCLIPFINEGIARLYESINQPDSSIKYFRSVLEAAKQCQLREFEISALQGIGRYHLDRGETDMAIRYFEQSFDISESDNFRPLRHISTSELHRAYKSIHNYKESLKYHELMKSLEDSLYNKKNRDEISRLTARYEFDKEKQLIEAERVRRELEHSEDLKRQILTRNYMIAGLILTLILIGTLWRLYTIKKRANLQLTRLNSEKNELIGVVAHDLRNPLTAITALLPLLKRDLKDHLDDDHKSFFDEIQRGANRMIEMIAKVLDVNAIESETMNIDLEIQDIASILKSVANSFQVSSEKKEIDIVKDLPENKYFALVDSNYTIQIFENLISNAIKFSPPGKNIYLSVGESDGWVLIKVKDEGPGISEEDQKLLFRRFTKLSAKPTGSESSTGLGLSIVKKYVEAMNGSIAVISELNSGTTFEVQFRMTGNS